MGDFHVLERLERLRWRETELALRLYRDPELVGALLEEVDALEPLAPLLAPAVYDLVLSRDRLSRELLYENINRFAKDRRVLTSRDEEILRTIWRAHWAVGHETARLAASDRAE